MEDAKFYKIFENLSLGRFATFIPNKNLSIYNWFYYKEGFSRDLVNYFIEKFNINEKDTVLDPFVGSGTTLLCCKEKGINAIGFDVFPISVFVSKVKIENYDIEKLKNLSTEIFSKKFQRKSENIPKFIKRAFPKYVLEDILFFKEIISEIPEEKYRNFFMLGLMNSALKCSYIFKDGANVKILKKEVAPLREMFKRKVKRMIKDIENFNFKDSKIYVDFCDARNLKIPDECIDAIITSPPYLNKIEYTKIYEIEESLFLQKENFSPIRSFIGMKECENFEIDKLNLNLPFQAKAYFDDLYKVIKEMYRVCKKNAKIAIIIGDAVFIDRVIDVPKILAEISENFGFKVNEIIIVNKRIATTPSRVKVGVMNESIVVMEK